MLTQATQPPLVFFKPRSLGCCTCNDLYVSAFELVRGNNFNSLGCRISLDGCLYLMLGPCCRLSAMLVRDALVL